MKTTIIKISETSISTKAFEKSCHDRKFSSSKI